MGIQSAEPPAAPADSAKPRRSYSWLRYAWVVGLLVYVAAVYFTDGASVIASLRAVHPGWVAALFAILMAGQWLRAYKWRVVLGPGKQAIGVHFLSKLGGNYTPGRIGEFAPLFLREHRSAALAAWIAADRILEILCTLIFGIGGVAAIGLSQGPALIVLVVGLGIGCTLFIVFLGHPAWVNAVARILPACGRLQLIHDALRAVQQAYGAIRPRMPVAAFITIVAAAIDIAAGLTLFMAFGYALPFMLFAGIKCLYAIVAAIPWAPPASGLPMLSAAAVIHEAGNVPESVIIAAVGVNVVVTQAVFWLSFWAGTFGMTRRSTGNSE